VEGSERLRHARLITITAPGEINHRIPRQTIIVIAIIQIRIPAGHRGKAIRAIHGGIPTPVVRAREAMTQVAAARVVHQVVVVADPAVRGPGLQVAATR
jgi:hypothetical protein